ncbi:phosphopantetheine-binding protein [Magnetospirillum fulvum]|uniref:phosphopantetheine-binding protein n=1 Tax=Magnetospirillum fulvum TaxID=1082 RepID=UPI000945B3F7|nr:phosphopantetheine-binding protein [Magnetospirillum fulvum]
MDALELELKRLIVSSLNLEDVSPEEIVSDEPLFGDGGLGLDSIDALELGVALRKTYGIRIETVSDEVRRHFASVAALAAFITEQKEARS